MCSACSTGEHCGNPNTRHPLLLAMSCGTLLLPRYHILLSCLFCFVFHLFVVAVVCCLFVTHCQMAEAPIEAAIFQAAKSGYIDDLESLASPQFNANFSIFDECGNTPLHYAAGGNHHAAVAFLIAHQADINAKNRIAGDTPLHKVWLCRLRIDVAAVVINVVVVVIVVVVAVVAVVVAVVVVVVVVVAWLMVGNCHVPID
jgi:hypothetical protein